MGAFLELLSRAFRIVRIKPKLFDRTDDTRNNVLVNLDLCDMVCEVQLMLYEHSQIKREMHKVYEITRAASFVSCLRPTWPSSDHAVLKVASAVAGEEQDERMPRFATFKASDSDVKANDGLFDDHLVATPRTRRGVEECAF